MLAHALTQCHADRTNAALVVIGDPGGVVNFRDGVVIAVHSPGAPGVAMLSSGPPDRVGAAMADAAFAIAVGGIAHYLVDDTADVVSPTSAGISPTRLLGQVAVRLAVLAATACPVSPYRERPVPTGRVEPAADLREIVTHATGRRTARDIAFAIGRDVHSVTVDVARLLGEDVLALAPAGVFTGRVHHAAGALRPRASPRPVDDGSPEAQPCSADGGSADVLPRSADGGSADVPLRPVDVVSADPLPVRRPGRAGRGP